MTAMPTARGVRQVRDAQERGVLWKQDRAIGSREHWLSRFVGLIECGLVIIHGQSAVVGKDVIGAGGNPGFHELARFLGRLGNSRVRQRVFKPVETRGLGLTLSLDTPVNARGPLALPWKTASR